MNFGKLLAKLNNDIKTEVRWSKCFYETCQEKNLMPKHIKIYIYINKNMNKLY